MLLVTFYKIIPTSLAWAASSSAMTSLSVLMGSSTLVLSWGVSTTVSPAIFVIFVVTRVSWCVQFQVSDPAHD